MNKPSVLAAVTALACFAATAIAQTPGSLDVRATMQQQVNPATLAIWDIGNNAMNDEGVPDLARLDAAQWLALETRAGELAAAGRAMAGATGLVAASPGTQDVGQGEVTMANVQRQLDDDPAGFRQMAVEMAAHADQLAAAARARDAAATSELIGGMDAVCGTCHSHFWYPD